jgi:hypothetical protein
MPLAFTYLPELDHKFQIKKPLPSPLVSQGVTALLTIPLLVFIVVVFFCFSLWIL